MSYQRPVSTVTSRRRADLAVAAADGALQRGAGVAPAADVPPDVVVGVLDMEQDQEALRAAGLAGLERVGVVGPVRVADRGAAVGLVAGLAQDAVRALQSPCPRCQSSAFWASLSW